MPTNEQVVLARPGTHFFSPLTALTVRTSDPAPPETGFILYPYYNATMGIIEARIIFAGGTPQVLASST
jgi:hypothetical protein